MTNQDLEIKNALGNKTQIKKRLRNIAIELGNQKIDLSMIAEGTKNKQFLDALDSQNATYYEALVMQQMAKAIVDADTKAAEFIRDTAGEKPSMQVDMNDVTKGISQMSTEELEAHLAQLKALEEELTEKETA